MTQVKGLPPFHHSHWETIPQLDTYSLTNIFLRAHPNFLHFISSCDPPPENPSAPSSIGMNIECVYVCVNVYTWFHHIPHYQRPWGSQRVQRDFLPYKMAGSSYQELATVTKNSGFQEEGLFGTGVHVSGMVSKRDHTKRTTVLFPSLSSKALWQERAQNLGRGGNYITVMTLCWL